MTDERTENVHCALCHKNLDDVETVYTDPGSGRAFCSYAHREMLVFGTD